MTDAIKAITFLPLEHDPKTYHLTDSQLRKLLDSVDGYKQVDPDIEIYLVDNLERIVATCSLLSIQEFIPATE